MFDIEESAIKGELFDGHFQLLGPLSTDGATADVWLALDTNTIDTEYDEEGAAINENAHETGMLVAIKIYRPKNALDIEGEQRFRDEYKIVYECRHENLLQPSSFSIYKGIPYLVLPYCKQGSSEQLIGKKLSADEMWKFISDVSAGLAKLHSNQPQIVHQDIKPANILIDNSHNFAITDFGISSSNQGTHVGYYDEENSGTLAYMAPERFGDNPKPSPESDVWAFGATLCEILTGKVPFGEEGGKNQADGAAMPALVGLPVSIRNLICACLQKDPNSRPSARQIHQAAQSRQYPPKRKTFLAAVIPALLGGLLVGGYFLMKPKPQMPQTPAEAYAVALRLMSYNDADSLNLGFKMMDSLGKKDYVPAMYQIAFTNGWWGTDSCSLQRKKLLGIEVDSNNLPIDNHILKTQALLTDILDQNDTSFANIKANVAYILADSYINERLTNHLDYTKANKYLELSQKWAKTAKNDSLLKVIKETRVSISNRLEKKDQLNPKATRRPK